MSRTPRDVVARGLDLMLAKDMNAMADLWAVDGTAEFPFAPAGAPSFLSGREAVRDYLSDYTEHVDVREIPVVRMHQTTDPEVIVTEFSARGVSLRNDQPYEMHYIAVITVRDGNIVSYRDYWNPIAVANVMGSADALGGGK